MVDASMHVVVVHLHSRRNQSGPGNTSPQMPLICLVAEGRIELPTLGL